MYYDVVVVPVAWVGITTIKNGRSLQEFIVKISNECRVSSQYIVSMQVDPVFDMTISSMAPIEAVRMEGFWRNKIVYRW